MRVLWLCNRGLTGQDVGASGTWLVSMAPRLAESPGIELGIVAPSPTRGVARQDWRRVRQWLVRGNPRLRRDGLPPLSLVRAIRAICDEFKPDLIHVWGTENYWGLLTARRHLRYPALLEMQGLKGGIARVFCGGLSAAEQLHCVGPKELLRRRILVSEQRAFARWGLLEREMIQGHRFISFQSPWMAAQVLSVNPAARLFKVERVLRPAFMCTSAWRPSPQDAVVFCSAAYPSPFKGLHVAVRALDLLRQRAPNARLRVAGALQRQGIRQEGYMRWVNALARRLGLQDAVEWLGPLSGEQILAELSAASAMVIPTFMESYCVAMAEAMAVGVPTAVAYTGGTSYLGKDEETCLFFPTGDEAMCAYQLERLLTDQTLAARLSDRARETAAARNDATHLVQRQIEVYRQVLAGSSPPGGAA